MTTNTRTLYPARPSNWGGVVAELVRQYPGHDEYDIAEIAEERWGRPVSNSEFDKIRTSYLRAKLQEYRPELEDLGEWEA